MTVEAFVPSPVYIIAGPGPYAVTHPYREGTLRVTVWRNGVRTQLSPGEFTVSPASATSSGAITLTAAAVARHAGGRLYITRETVPEQGWEGTSSRERGLQAQLDWLTQGIQDASIAIGSALRSERPLPPFEALPGRALIFNDAGEPVSGPTAVDIAGAQGFAAAAQASADAAAAAAASVGSLPSTFLFRQFRTIAEVLADTTLTYTTGGPGSVVADDRILALAERQVWRVAASIATTHHVTTAGGVKLFVEPLHGRFNVRAFGALGNGTTDDTAALLAAYEAACAVKGTVLLPSGRYICAGIDLGGAPHRGCTWEGAAYDGRGNGFLSSTIQLKNGANREIFVLLPGDAPHQVFRHLVLDGNQNQQSVNAYIFRAADDLVTGYPYGAHFEWCHFQYGRGGGIYIGKRRAWNYIANCSFYECGLGNNGHGIFVDTFDVTLHNLHVGNSGGFGVYVASTSQLQATSLNVYFNQLGGIFLGPEANDCTFTNCSIDRNLRVGVEARAKSGLGYDGARSFVNVRFLANSNLQNGAFPDVLVGAGCNDLVFVAASFMGDEAFAGNKAAYAIQFADAAGSVRLTACRFAAKTRWSNAEWTNDYTCLRGGDLPGFTDRAISATARALTANGAEALVLSNPGGATAHIQIGGDAGVNPFILPRGQATAINMVLRPKGTGTLLLGGGSTTRIQASDAGLGFHGEAPTARPNITGSRGGNAALTSLLSALAAIGLITNSTS